MNRTRNLIIVAVGLVAVVLIAVVASRGAHKNALPVKLQTITYSSFTVKLPENGVVMHPHTETVPALVGGNIEHIYVRAGQAVYAGQLLATVNNPSLEYNAAGSQADYSTSAANVQSARVAEENAKVQYQGSVATAKSNMDEAKRVYEADVALLRSQAIARSTVDADRAKLDQAKVTYDQAAEQLQLGAVSGYGQNSIQSAQAAAEKARILNDQNQQQVAFTRIVAPFSGIIQSIASEPTDALRNIQSGDAVSAGQSLFTIADGTGYIVKAQVDEQDIINVRDGQRANISGQDFPGKTIRGHVAHIAPIAVKSTDASSTAKQVLTTIALDRSPSFLKDGMTADVDILTTNISHALVIPNDAIVKKDGKLYVYVVKGGIATKRAIKVARTGDTTSLVSLGLAAGDTIVAKSDPDLVDGKLVTPMPSPSPGTSSSPGAP